MLLRELITLFERDIDRLYNEIESYTDESVLWKTEGHISNSAGNLCLHLLGNLQAFVGHELGGFEYTRNREFEFEGKNVPKTQLLLEINNLKRIVISSLEGLDESMIPKDYPKEVFGKPMSNEYFLIHLYGHFNYHLGQINYHRRLLHP
ncbi:DUF1572 family protein [Algoriphagus machipongonensis]|uniref:DinB superfamily protein n=1 Tax=Algoriphagus machipongonensis TaxID=388413 RepID=A3HSQ0_9BACT|nr:DUF1572 family protein [Algoriphagus machipongonensis]EAZ82868.1 hypothetical protein ALPR1_11645 [Algoriphagus machipongonensis]